MASEFGSVGQDALIETQILSMAANGWAKCLHPEPATMLPDWRSTCAVALRTCSVFTVQYMNTFAHTQRDRAVFSATEAWILRVESARKRPGHGLQVGSSPVERNSLLQSGCPSELQILSGRPRAAASWGLAGMLSLDEVQGSQKLRAHGCC